MESLSFDNPVFATYAMSAAVMVLLGIATAWISVIQMLRFSSDFRAPEDMKKSLINADPRPDQTAPSEPVGRFRRIMLNHLENPPFFCVIGLLFVMTAPSLVLAQWLFYGYVVARFINFFVYATAQIHEIRATFWTIGSLILIAMAVMVLQVAMAAL